MNAIIPHRLFLHTLKWDIKIAYKYGIIPVAFALSAIYVLAFIFSDTSNYEKLIPILVFSDPVMYGFMFTSILILFEKDAGTQQALAISPLSTKQYIVSKATVFTLLALVCSTLIILSAHTQKLNILIFLLAVSLSASLFVFIGIISTSFTKNFNQFILSMPIVLAPATLPFLGYFNIYNSVFYYLLPTHASLLLFNYSINEPQIFNLIYAIIYLLLWNIMAFKWAAKTYNKRILKTTIK